MQGQKSELPFMISDLRFEYLEKVLNHSILVFKIEKEVKKGFLQGEKHGEM